MVEIRWTEQGMKISRRGLWELDGCVRSKKRRAIWGGCREEREGGKEKRCPKLPPPLPGLQVHLISFHFISFTAIGLIIIHFFPAHRPLPIPPPPSTNERSLSREVVRGGGAGKEELAMVDGEGG